MAAIASDERSCEVWWPIMTQILIESAVRTAAGVIFVGEFLFTAYPLVRKYGRNDGLFPRLLYSYILSTALMISILWLAYTFSTSFTLLVATSTLLAAAGIGGTVFFVYDLRRMRRPLSREELGFLLLLAFAVLMAVVSAISLPFSAQGDPYAYYVPIGRYLNQYPGAYVGSYYRFSLSRNFAYYALYAHADLLGFSFGSYLLLPIPFLLGTIFGVISVAKRLTQDNKVALLAATFYVISVYFGLILKFNTFYLGNLLMSTMALFYCYSLLPGLKGRLERAAIPLSTFAMLLLYDFAFLLLIPVALVYVALRKPRLAFYLAAGLALPLFLIVSQTSVTLNFAQFPQLDFQSSIVFLGLLVIVVAGVRAKTNIPPGSSTVSFPIIMTYAAALASMLVQRIVNLFSYGFMTLDSIPLSGPVMAYMKSAGWFYSTPPDIFNTLLSIFFSDVFFGWGFFFVAYWLLRNRGRPVATFFLAVLPLIVLVETINSNYLRFAEFLAPLIVVFLASGLYTMLRRNAVLVGVSLLFVELLQRAVTTLPGLDYEGRAIASSLNIALFGATLAFAAISYFLRRYPRGMVSLSEYASRIRNWIARYKNFLARVPLLSSMGWRQTAGVLILVLCIPVFSYNVLAVQHSAEIYDSVGQTVDRQVLPLIQDNSTVLTIELVHVDFYYYKDVQVIWMAQPWVLETFLSLHLANVTALLTWLSTNKIRYVFEDRSLTYGNQDALGLFDQLSTSCSAYSQCTPLYNDGRFILVKISA